jgi:hypothetical protein
MKNLKTLAVLATFIMSCNFVMAQEEGNYSKPKTSKWVSDKGFWVIESNVKTPRSSVVHFYNNNNKLISTVSVEGKRLNPERRKTLKNLKKALEQVVDADATAGRTIQPEELIAVLTGRKRSAM